MNNYPDSQSLLYEGVEWEAAKAAFAQKWGDSGDACVDMLFDDFYAGWNAALRWREREDHK